MTKKSREIIALLVFFMCVILIFQITEQSTASVKKNIHLPKNTKVFVQFNQKALFEKILVSELYGPNANEFVKKLVSLTNNSGDLESNSEYTAFIENSDLNLDNPLDLIAVSIQNKDVVFLRAKSQSEVNKEFLYTSNHDYLYLQLNERSLNRQDILKAINNKISFQFTSPITDDIAMYKIDKQKLYNVARINIEDRKLTVLVPAHHISHKKSLELEPKGFHVFIANDNNILDFISKKTPDIKLKSVSINYYGLNSYNNPIIFPDADYLLEFKNSITSGSLIHFLSSALMDMEFSHKSVDLSGQKLTDEEIGHFLIGDIKLYYKRINDNCFFIGANTKHTNTQITDIPFAISGKPSQLMVINNLTGWKALIAEEFISGIPVLSQLKSMLDNMLPIETKQNNKETVIDLRFKNNHALYTHLLDLLMSI
jgi:hypothetical protein